MVENHSDSERGDPLPPHGLLFSINSKGYFICTSPQTGTPQKHIPRPLLHQSWSTGWNEKINEVVPNDLDLLAETDLLLYTARQWETNSSVYNIYSGKANALVETFSFQGVTFRS